MNCAKMPRKTVVFIINNVAQSSGYFRYGRVLKFWIQLRSVVNSKIFTGFRLDCSYVVQTTIDECSS